MKELTEQEKKVFRRLRLAYRRAVVVVLHRKGTRDDLKAATQRITQRAVVLGWLEVPK